MQSFLWFLITSPTSRHRSVSVRIARMSGSFVKFSNRARLLAASSSWRPSFKPSNHSSDSRRNSLCTARSMRLRNGDLPGRKRRAASTRLSPCSRATARDKYKSLLSCGIWSSECSPRDASTAVRAIFACRSAGHPFFCNGLKPTSGSCPGLKTARSLVRAWPIMKSEHIVQKSPLQVIATTDKSGMAASASKSGSMMPWVLPHPVGPQISTCSERRGNPRFTGAPVARFTPRGRPRLERRAMLLLLVNLAKDLLEHRLPLVVVQVRILRFDVRRYFLLRRNPVFRERHLVSDLYLLAAHLKLLHIRGGELLLRRRGCRDRLLHCRLCRFGLGCGGGPVEGDALGDEQRLQPP